MTHDQSKLLRRVALGLLAPMTLTASLACGGKSTTGPTMRTASPTTRATSQPVGGVEAFGAIESKMPVPAPVAAPATVPATARAASTRASTTRATTMPATTRRANHIDQIEAFERADAQQMPAPGGIVFYGSSTIRGWKTAEAFPGLPVINRGFGGSQMHQALMYDDRVVFKYQPKVVVLYEGDNDLAAGKTPETVMAEIRTFDERLKAKVPDAKLVLVSTKPSPSRWGIQPKMTELNAMQRAYAEANADRVTYFDGVSLLLGEDGEPRPEFYLGDRLHMTPAGYAVWNEAIGPVLTKLLRD